MHHKRKRPRSRRAGCKMCKFWKMNGAKPAWKLKVSELRRIQPDGPDGEKEAA